MNRRSFIATTGASVVSWNAFAAPSEKVNIGMESVNYINEYENSKNLIFKK